MNLASKKHCVLRIQANFCVDFPHIYIYIHVPFVKIRILCLYMCVHPHTGTKSSSLGGV